MASEFVTKFGALPVVRIPTPPDGNCALHALRSRLAAALQAGLLTLPADADRAREAQDQIASAESLRVLLAEMASPDTIKEALLDSSLRDFDNPMASFADFKARAPLLQRSGYANRWALLSMVQNVCPGMGIITIQTYENKHGRHCNYEFFSAGSTVRCVALLERTDAPHYSSLSWTPSRSGLVETEAQLFGLLRALDETAIPRHNQLLAGPAAFDRSEHARIVLEPALGTVVLPYGIQQRQRFPTIRWDAATTAQIVSESLTHLSGDGAGSALWCVSSACAGVVAAFCALIHGPGRRCGLSVDDDSRRHGFARLDRALLGENCVVDGTDELAHNLSFDLKEFSPADVEFLVELHRLGPLDRRWFAHNGYPPSLATLRHLTRATGERVVLISAESGGWTLVPDWGRNEWQRLDPDPNAGTDNPPAFALPDRVRRLIVACRVRHVAVHFEPARANSDHMVALMGGKGSESTTGLQMEMMRTGTVRFVTPLSP